MATIAKPRGFVLSRLATTVHATLSFSIVRGPLELETRTEVYRSQSSLKLRIMTNTRASARTLVLTNSDLLYCIFTFVPEPLYPGLLTREYSYLAPCTTVCRRFHEPATRLLWRKLGSLLPLWQLLAPLDAKKSTRTDYSGRLDDPDELLDYLNKVSTATAFTLILTHEVR